MAVNHQSYLDSLMTLKELPVRAAAQARQVSDQAEQEASRLETEARRIRDTSTQRLTLAAQKLDACQNQAKQLSITAARVDSPTGEAPHFDELSSELDAFARELSLLHSTEAEEQRRLAAEEERRRREAELAARRARAGREQQTLRILMLGTVLASMGLGLAGMSYVGAFVGLVGIMAFTGSTTICQIIRTRDRNGDGNWFLARALCIGTAVLLVVLGTRWSSSGHPLYPALGFLVMWFVARRLGSTIGGVTPGQRSASALGYGGYYGGIIAMVSLLLGGIVDTTASPGAGVNSTWYLAMFIAVTVLFASARMRDQLTLGNPSLTVQI